MIRVSFSKLYRAPDLHGTRLEDLVTQGPMNYWDLPAHWSWERFDIKEVGEATWLHADEVIVRVCDLRCECGSAVAVLSQQLEWTLLLISKPSPPSGRALSMESLPRSSGVRARASRPAKASHCNFWCKLASPFVKAGRPLSS